MLQILLVTALSIFLFAPVFASDTGTVILMHGGDRPQKEDLLIRNGERLERAGFSTSIVTAPPDAARILQEAKRRGDKVYVVATRRGLVRTSFALAAGMRPDARVVFSGDYDQVRNRLGSPEDLPPTLVIQHRRDNCKGTNPARAEPFRAWAKGKVE